MLRLKIIIDRSLCLVRVYGRRSSPLYPKFMEETSYVPEGFFLSLMAAIHRLNDTVG